MSLVEVWGIFGYFHFNSLILETVIKLFKGQHTDQAFDAITSRPFDGNLDYVAMFSEEEEAYKARVPHVTNTTNQFQELKIPREPL